MAVTKNREGSPRSPFEPILVRFESPDAIVDEHEIQAFVNDVPQHVAGFIFSPKKYYLVARGEYSKPRIVVVTVKDLPPGLKSLTPDNLVVSDARPSAS